MARPDTVMGSVDLDYLGRLFGLAGRVALVTGARQGLGRAISLALARAGARLVVTSRDAAALRSLEEELETLEAEHLGLALELADELQIERAVETAEARWGRLDIVISNAGMSIRRPALDYRGDEWDAVLDVNLRGTFLLARAAARRMKEREGGRIINVSSTFARRAVADRAAYAASKAGVEQLTRALAVEWAPHRITVNAIAPGATMTETRASVLSDPATRRDRIAAIPLGRFGVADDVIGAALLLAGDAGGFITGHTLVVDGGYTAGAAS